jgi:hypothetical protein
VIESERKADITPDPTVTSVAGSCSVPIAPTVRYVKAGTPLRPSPGGWVPSHDGYGELVATDGKWGGEPCSAARVAVLTMPGRTFDFPATYRVRIEDVDDNGRVKFTPSDSGPYLVLSDRQVLMDMGYASIHNLLLGMAQKYVELRDVLEQVKVLESARTGSE